MTNPSPAKLDALRRWFSRLDSALVAFSGGVDSALLASVAHEQLGDRALACIGVSPSYPRREREAAVRLARELNLQYRLVDTTEHLDVDYARNDAQRCFYCKQELYGQLQRIAQQEQWAAIVDGTNADDTSDDRPGRRAAQERSVRSPLVELGFTKDDVRAAARSMHLDVWDKPAMACLSSRVPRGTTITPELLEQIERAEDVLAALGFSQFRVRHHGEVARIELERSDLPRAVEQAERIVEGIRTAGYRFVALDLAGFRSGSLSGQDDPPTIALTIGMTHDRLL
jgi:uncharacterized protein